MSDQEDRAGGEAGRGEARVTPYEMVFTEHFEADVFPDVVREALQHGVDPLRPDGFHLLSTVGDAVREVVPPEAPVEALEQYRALLYHAFNFWRYGKRLYFLEPATARYLVEAAPSPGDWELALPAPSLYLQLPANLFWGSISPEATPEPVDGFFLAATDGEDALGEPFHRLAVLLVLGIRRNRAGFSVIPLDTEVGPGIATAWSAAEADESRADFRSTLPGGEISGLYSILTTREVLKLTGRALWYVDSFPEEIEAETPLERRAAERPGSTRLPGLPYLRVGLGRGAAG